VMHGLRVTQGAAGSNRHVARKMSAGSVSGRLKGWLGLGWSCPLDLFFAYGGKKWQLGVANLYIVLKSATSYQIWAVEGLEQTDKLAGW